MAPSKRAGAKTTGKPLCSMCGKYPISMTGAAACHSPKCKRQLAEERQRMAAADRQRKSKKQLAASKDRMMRPDKHRRELAADVRRFMQYGFTESEAVWRVAREAAVTPAEVLLAHQSVGAQG